MTDPARPNPDLTGCELDGYRLLRRLGSGGMAEVYLAEQHSLNRKVALKVLHAQLAEDASYIQRFLNEARAAASLVHANIVQIYEVGKADGVHFIAQEYVQGRNLAEVLARQGAFEPRLVLDVLRQVVAALCRAAEMGIVHRDIKPDNLLLSHSGEVKVADFGLARVLESAEGQALTKVGITMGTPLYMSPEQIEGRALDARSDIYSLGVTCYHLLTGNPPHSGDTALAIAMGHLNQPAPPLQETRTDIPAGLARIIHRMLAKQPNGRYATPEQLLVDLRKLASEAADEGWAEGPDNWSNVLKSKAAEGHTQTASQLKGWMQAEARLRPTRWIRRLSFLGLAAAVLLGVGVGFATRERPLLAGRQVPVVQQRSTVWAQLYHAKMTDSEAAWQAVWKWFPDEDTYPLNLARQGIVRYYLLISEEQEDEKALPFLSELKQLSASDKSLESLQAFTFASLCIAHAQLGNANEAREARAQLTNTMLTYLRQNETVLHERLQATFTDDPTRSSRQRPRR